MSHHVSFPLNPGDKFIYLFIGHGDRKVVDYDDKTSHVEYQICGYITTIKQ